MRYFVQHVFDLVVFCNFSFVEVYFAVRVFDWVVLSVGQVVFFFFCL